MHCPNGKKTLLNHSKDCLESEKEMKKVLFTIQWYPPRRSANVLCDDKIIKELLKTGDYEIHCLVYRLSGLPDSEIVNGIKVHRVSRGLYFRYYLWAKESKSKLNQVINKIAFRIKQIITIPFYPCYEPLATRKIVREAKRLHKEEKFDIVISEHHGFDTLYAGHKLKEYDPNIKFISILWDPFTGKEPAKYLPKGYAEKKLLKSEKKILSNADCIIAMESSREYHERMSKNKSYYDKYRFLDIPGIVKPKEASTGAKFIDETKINIVYSGVLSLPERDPSYIVELLNETKFAKDINLVFFAIGNGVDKLQTLKEKFKGNLVINGYVSREEISAVYHKADVLINLGGSNPYMVPSKIFEYMSYGKLILSTYYIDDESSKKYFEQYPLALCVDVRKDMDENKTSLEAFIESNWNKTIDFDEVKKSFPYNLPESYVEVIKEITE